MTATKIDFEDHMLYIYALLTIITVILQLTLFADASLCHLLPAQTLLVQDYQWVAPRLLQLPDNYNIIFQYYHRKACTACKKVPKDPALCLVCGAFVCLKGACCKQQGTCECVLVSSLNFFQVSLQRCLIRVAFLQQCFNRASACVSVCVLVTMQHSQHCGAATGIFLLINASVIIIIRGHRFCLWGSVYLDAHGEEDRDLRWVAPHHISVHDFL